MRLNISNSDLVSGTTPSDGAEKATINWRSSEEKQSYADKANAFNRISLALQIAPNVKSEEEFKAVLALVPEDVPPGVNLRAKMSEAFKMTSLMEFKKAVGNKTNADYKQINKKYENFGNWSYTFEASAFGLPETLARMAAGIAQIMAGTSPLFKDNPTFSILHFGDDPHDQEAMTPGFKAMEMMQQEASEALEKDAIFQVKRIRAWEPDSDKATAPEHNKPD